eukprot:15971995-Heterocapsa_arctica.AAC.1
MPRVPAEFGGRTRSPIDFVDEVPRSPHVLIAVGQAPAAQPVPVLLRVLHGRRPRRQAVALGMLRP